MNHDIICFSHLRWNFVYQRPQHLMSRFAKHSRVFFVEEPVYEKENELYKQRDPESNVIVITPCLQAGTGKAESVRLQRSMLERVFQTELIENYIFWYYSPMALEISRHFKPLITIYDCMDELSSFKFAPPELLKLESELFALSQLVFTGGHTLFEFKKKYHSNIFPFPSSIDKKHFHNARTIVAEPDDQVTIPHPRIGFYGVLDERLDICLVKEIADKKPDWHLILIGPVVKIDPDTLPKNKNIHYLGPKHYKDLPDYLAGWDIAMMPFALNESTKYISPTKTPEYLCGGKQVISTSITDVVNDYGNHGLVKIADSAKEFITAAEEIFEAKDVDRWLERTDRFLDEMSWDITCNKMKALVNKALDERLIKVNI